MPKGLRRWYGGGDLHYITCSCYQRRPFLGSVSRRDLFLNIFEQVRRKYEFQVVGYIVMPEHVHLLIGEPDERTIAVPMQVLKQRVSQQCHVRGRTKPKEEGIDIILKVMFEAAAALELNVRPKMSFIWTFRDTRTENRRQV